MSIEITYDEAVDLLKLAVEERGADYVYPRSNRDAFDSGCVYFEGTTPSCIVGHVLAYKDVDGLDLRYANEIGIANLASFVDNIDLVIDERTVSLLEKAQDAQDSGKTWGEALAAAGVVL